MITSEELEKFAEIVGPEWVNAEPCMMDTYSWYMNPEVLTEKGERWLPRPAAVVMPESAEQVQEIVKLANRLRIMLKPLSTGWGAWAAVSRERVVVLDLKRMDRIIELDLKNRIAVIEPYVKAIILQTILFQHGLNVNVISCGGNHSILASVTSAWGTALTGSSMGYNGRNLLGVEWVLPNGDLLRLGSGGEGAGWFTADGPGPSLRGIMRGYMGAFGGLGVFTKAAVKLYRWDGPAELQVSGCSPHYLVDNLPENLGLFSISFATAEDMADAGYLMGEAELNYAEFRLPPFMTAVGSTEDNLSLKKFWESGLFQKLAKYCLIVAVMGRSRGEYEWKLKALTEILREVRGVILPMVSLPKESRLRLIRWVLDKMDDPLFLLRRFPSLQRLTQKLPVDHSFQKRVLSDLFWVMLRHAINTQGNFRPSQAMFTSLGSFDTWDLGIRQSEWVAQRKRRYIKQGLMLDDGGDCGCGSTFEYGHFGYLEGIGMYSIKDPRSVEAVGKFEEEAVRACIDQALGIPIAGYGERMNSILGPHCGNYHLWMKKIKAALDPNLCFDPFFYARPERENLPTL